MERFSDRYGYTKPSNIFVKEGLTKPIQDCICSCIDELENDLRTVSIDDYQNMQIHIWTHYFFVGKMISFTRGIRISWCTISKIWM